MRPYAPTQSLDPDFVTSAIPALIGVGSVALLVVFLILFVVLLTRWERKRDRLRRALTIRHPEPIVDPERTARFRNYSQRCLLEQ